MKGRKAREKGEKGGKGSMNMYVALDSVYVL